MISKSQSECEKGARRGRVAKGGTAEKTCGYLRQLDGPLFIQQNQGTSSCDVGSGQSVLIHRRAFKLSLQKINPSVALLGACSGERPLVRFSLLTLLFSG